MKRKMIALALVLATALINASGSRAASAVRHHHYVSHHRAIVRHRATPHRARKQVRVSFVSLNVQRAPIYSVLQTLFRRGGHDFVLGPGVTGTVTASLHHYTFEHALQVVLSANSLPLQEIEQNGIYVITRSHPAPHRQVSHPATAPVRRQYPIRARVPRSYVLPGTGAVRVVR